jgi:hypothetical protein
MADIEVRVVTPEEIGRELEDTLRRRQENKYAFQVKLIDLDIAVDEEKATAQGIEFPFRSIEAAEAALRSGIIKPNLLIEADGTQHEVVAFDPTPIGYSGFQDCVTHSLAVTDHGLFEVGRFAAASLHSTQKEWQWFLHQRLASPEDLATWQAIYPVAPHQLLAILLEEFASERNESK